MSTAKARLVFVHGRGQQERSAANVRKEWLGSLKKAWGSDSAILDDIEVICPYYGDILTNFIVGLAEGLPAGVSARGGGMHNDESYQQFKAAAVAEMQVHSNVTDDEVRSYFDEETAERGLQNHKWVLALTRLLEHRVGVHEFFIDRFLKDVWLYLKRSTVRNAINSSAVRALETELPTIVIAHSLGSVVAYDVLRKLDRNKTVSLITVGSPLSLRVVRESLVPMTYPPCITDWINSRDDSDIVALHPLKAPHFKIDGSVIDHSSVKNDTSGAHGISGYLEDDGTAAYILEALERAKAI